MGNKWEKRIKKSIEGYSFDVGVLKDTQHKAAIRGELKAFAGGPARKVSRDEQKATIGEILIFNQARANKDFLRLPFKEKTSEIVKFSREFLKLALKHPGANVRRVENLLQAIVRNPILRGDYGVNTSKAAKAKGFNRYLMDTAQMFRAIRARMNKNV